MASRPVTHECAPPLIVADEFEVPYDWNCALNRLVNDAFYSSLKIRCQNHYNYSRFFMHTLWPP